MPAFLSIYWFFVLFLLFVGIVIFLLLNWKVMRSKNSLGRKGLLIFVMIVFFIPFIYGLAFIANIFDQNYVYSLSRNIPLPDRDIVFQVGAVEDIYKGHNSTVIEASGKKVRKDRQILLCTQRFVLLARILELEIRSLKLGLLEDYPDEIEWVQSRATLETKKDEELRYELKSDFLYSYVSSERKRKRYLVTLHGTGKHDDERKKENSNAAFFETMVKNTVDWAADNQKKAKKLIMAKKAPDDDFAFKPCPWILPAKKRGFVLEQTCNRLDRPYSMYAEFFSKKIGLPKKYDLGLEFEDSTAETRWAAAIWHPTLKKKAFSIFELGSDGNYNSDMCTGCTVSIADLDNGHAHLTGTIKEPRDNMVFVIFFLSKDILPLVTQSEFEDIIENVLKT